MKRITTLLLFGLALAGPLFRAQFAVFDAAQEQHALQQIGADAKKLANQQMSLAQQVQMLARLDAEILKQAAILEQSIFTARYFDANAKRAWVSAGQSWSSATGQRPHIMARRPSGEQLSTRAKHPSRHGSRPC